VSKHTKAIRPGQLFSGAEAPFATAMRRVIEGIGRPFTAAEVTLGLEKACPQRDVDRWKRQGYIGSQIKTWRDGGELTLCDSERRMFAVTERWKRVDSRGDAEGAERGKAHAETQRRKEEDLKSEVSDLKTADGRPLRRVGSFSLLPAPPNTCSMCAVKHPENQPHNAQSLHYQYAFYSEHGRWPNWKDAMAHCTEEVKKLWTDTLKEKGVDVEAGQVNPRITPPPAEAGTPNG
jgi:hypothetical protein